MAGAEARRGDEQDATKRIYPGGPFDPAGLSKGNLEELKLKEVKNGRLAMVAFLGFVAQVRGCVCGCVYVCVCVRECVCLCNNA
jgi:hypothetical protein